MQVKKPTHPWRWELGVYLKWTQSLIISSLRLPLAAAHICWSSFRASSIDTLVLNITYKSQLQHLLPFDCIWYWFNLSTISYQAVGSPCFVMHHTLLYISFQCRYLYCTYQEKTDLWCCFIWMVLSLPINKTKNLKKWKMINVVFKDIPDKGPKCLV